MGVDGRKAVFDWEYPPVKNVKRTETNEVSTRNVLFLSIESSAEIRA